MQPSILIVEDDAAQRLALSDKLKTEGFHVITAEDGERGLKLALSDHPDLVLLDNRMPNMSGFQMLSRLRQADAWGEKVPVIFFSNIEPGSKDEKEDLEAISPTAYLMKGDTDLSAVVAKIRETLGVK
jgi:DNA-binding response OmpR family regulator